FMAAASPLIDDSIFWLANTRTIETPSNTMNMTLSFAPSVRAQGIFCIIAPSGRVTGTSGDVDSQPRVRDQGRAIEHDKRIAGDAQQVLTSAVRSFFGIGQDAAGRDIHPADGLVDKNAEFDALGAQHDQPRQIG